MGTPGLQRFWGHTTEGPEPRRKPSPGPMVSFHDLPGGSQRYKASELRAGGQRQVRRTLGCMVPNRRKFCQIFLGAECRPNARSLLSGMPGIKILADSRDSKTGCIILRRTFFGLVLRYEKVMREILHPKTDTKTHSCRKYSARNTDQKFWQNFAQHA